MVPRFLLAGSMVLAVYMPTCAPQIRPTVPPSQVQMREL